MNAHQNIITGFLIFCLGIMIGALIIIYQNNGNNLTSEVHISEITRSSEPNSAASQSPSILFKEVADNVTPTVVYIETTIPVNPDGVPDSGDHEFEDEQFWDRFLPRRRAQSMGSGVLISTDGYIITNNHVVAQSEGDVSVGLSDKRRYPAKIVGRDTSTDLAVLKIDERDLPAAIVGNSDNIGVGDWVIAVGNPFRLKSTVTAGIISALDRDVNIINDELRIESFIQTDAAINRGNSGGALVNNSGELIGINTAIATENGSSQGYGFAIPINMAIKVAKDLIELGEVNRPYLGVQISPIDHERANRLGLQNIRGVEIVNLVEDGSAYLGGIEVDDIVLEVNGIHVNEPNELQVQIALMSPGDVVNLRVLREGEEIEVDVQLKGLESELDQWARSEEDLRFEENEGLFEEQYFEFGITVTELTHSRDFNELELVITNVEENSEAWMQGLRIDFVITKVNGNYVENLGDLSNDIGQSLSESNSLNLTVLTDNGTEEEIEINS
ncbi:MAG: trypsin-like peptidase domain-containing protein [Balneolales bacterium]